MSDNQVVSYGPARGYSWEPFKPGNTAAVSHGATSDRIVTPLAAEIANSILDAVDYLRDPSYREAVRSWARAAARVELLERHVDEHGLLKADGEPSGAANLLARFQSQEANLASRLGLDPLSRARLGRDVAAQRLDMAQVLANLGNTPTDTIDAAVESEVTE